MPIIAISLVLLSVFVPIAFIPGIRGLCSATRRDNQRGDGHFGAERADVVARPLRDALLRHGGPRTGVMGCVLGGIDWVRDRYAGGVYGGFWAWRCGRWLVVLVFAGGIFGVRA